MNQEWVIYSSPVFAGFHKTLSENLMILDLTYYLCVHIHTHTNFTEVTVYLNDSKLFDLALKAIFVFDFETWDLLQACEPHCLPWLLLISLVAMLNELSKTVTA